MDIDQLSEDLSAAGLEPQQAEVYVRLLQTGPTKVQNLLPYFDTSRSTVYRLLDDLAELGYVAKSLDSPVVYEAVPPEKLFDTGRQRIEGRLQRLEDTRESWMDTLQSLQGVEAEGEPHHWSKMEGSSRIYERLQRMIQGAEESIRVVSNHESTTTSDMPVVQETWKLFARRVQQGGLSCDLLIDVGSTALEDLIHQAAEFDGVDLRDFSAEDTIAFVLVDDTELLMWVYPAPVGNIAKKDDVAVWTNAPGSVFAHRMLFDRLWAEAKPVKEGSQGPP